MTKTATTEQSPLAREIARVERDLRDLRRVERQLLDGDTTTSRAASHRWARLADAIYSQMGPDDVQVDAVLSDLAVLAKYEERLRGARFIGETAAMSVRESVRLRRAMQG